MESDEFDRVCDTIESKLETRESPSHLLQRGVIKTSLRVSPSIHERQSKIKFKKTSHQLDQKLTNRPDVNRLVESNILVSPSKDVAPSLQSKKKSLQFQYTASQLNQKLDNRPSHHTLVDSSIIKNVDNQSEHVSISSSGEHSFLMTGSGPTDSFHDMATLLEEKLVNRSDREHLLQNNIIKSVDIAPSIQAAQSALSLKLQHMAIDSKLEKRPFQRQLIESNIIRSDSTQRVIVDNSKLDQKLNNRPTQDELINHNILKDHLSNIQDRRQMLKFEQTKQRLNAKVVSRPSKDSLLESNILYRDDYDDKHNIDQDAESDQDNNIENNDQDKQASNETRRNRLNDLFNKRPTKSDLIENHILLQSREDVDSREVDDEEFHGNDDDDDDEDVEELVIRDDPDAVVVWSDDEEVDDEDDDQCE
ncbi:hypothetical protein SAMD00019534_014350, partial [Acytostelium subglobosum LB1]|uniref:hypothetical protein n=1 Tax=Acytostelium subglobosum LB1 TaxID=1410327 RepID=UPI000644C7DB